jgi:two-component system response regulator DevR
VSAHGSAESSAPAEAPGAPPIRVFLLDDHELVRRGLHDLIDAEPDVSVIGEAGTAAEAVTRISELLPDVAVLDLRLPDGNGVEVCRQIRSEHPSVACLILTSFDDRYALLAAIAAGAAGYVLKEIRSGELLDGIRRAAAGQSLLDPAVTESVLSRLRDEPGPPVRREGFSREELSVLRLVAAGMTDRQIGERLFLPEKAVKLVVTRLLVKLGLQQGPGIAGAGAAVGSGASLSRTDAGGDSG